MRKKTPWLLCSALALTLAFSGPGFCSGSAVPAVTAYAQEMGAPENSAEDAGTEEKVAAAEDDRTAAEAEQKESTEAAETASADQDGEAVSGTPAAADAAEDPDQEDPSGQDKKDPEEPEKKSGDGNEEDPAKTPEQENPSEDDSSKNSSNENSTEDPARDPDKDKDKEDSSKDLSFTVENWRNCSDLEGAVKSVKLDGKDITASRILSNPAKKTGTASDASSTASSGKKEETSAPLTFKAGQKISVEIELNKGFVFDNTAGHGWSVWWNHKNEDGEFLVVSGSEQAYASEDRPLLLRGTIELPPADKTKYEYLEPEDITFDTLTLSFDARKIIDSVDVTVTAPVCGTKVTNNEETGEQTGAPAVTAPKGASYKVLEDFPAWVDYENYKEGAPAPDDFAGQIKGDSTCYARVYLVPASDKYGFPTKKEMTQILQKKGSDMEVFFSSPSGLYLVVPVKPVHTDTEKVVTKNTKATCTSAGVKTTETRCKSCGLVLDTKEEKTPVDKNAHEWGDWEVTKEPSATQTGERTRVCRLDASHTQTQEIPATGEEEETVTYSFTKGADASWTKSTASTANLSFTVKRSADDDRTYDLFEGISIDNKTVSDKNYTAASGSLNLTLKNAYLKTLTAGKHTLTVKFRDGSATTKFTVKAASAAASKTTAKKAAGSNSPKTGDESQPLVWAALGACALAAILLIVFAKRKKN